MRFRPHLSDAQVAALLDAHFALGVRSLEFLPVGMDGWAYRAESTDGRARFAKLRQRSGPVALALTHCLHAELDLDWVLAPLPALDRALEVEAGGLWLSLYPFIEGRSVMARGYHPGEGEQVGRMLAQLHAAAPRLQPELLAQLPSESFARHQELAVRVLAQARQPQPAGSIQAELAGFIDAIRPRITYFLRRAKALGEQIRQRNPETVICHADIHADNILVDAGGRLTVTDWDGVMLAPPERDLSFWQDSPQWPELIAAYVLGRPVDQEICAYYGYEWVVQEIADYGENVFFLSHSDEQKADSLAEFKQVFAPGGVADQVLAA